MNSASIRILELLENGVIDVDQTIKMLKTSAAVPVFKKIKKKKITTELIPTTNIFSDLPSYFSPITTQNRI